MSDKPEPLSAILAEMRGAAKSTDLFNGEEVGEPLIRGTKVEEWADRIEAAVERERAPGNAAALREALEESRKFLLTNKHGYFESRLIPQIEAALAAPARNCDRFATLDEARKAFQDLRGHKTLADVELWDSMDEAGALVRWFFAPAEGGDHA